MRELLPTAWSLIVRRTLATPRFIAMGAVPIGVLPPKNVTTPVGCSGPRLAGTILAVKVTVGPNVDD